MKTVVVYYTRFGHTTKVAEALARDLGAEVRRIEEVKQRSFMEMGWGSITNARFKIKPMNLDLSDCGTVVLCTPIWAGRPACPARTFLRDARIDGKKVHLLVSTGGGEIDRPVAIIAGDLAKKNATVGATGRVVTGMGKKDSTDDELRQAGREFARRVKGTGS
jgi:flavorubredoxin